MRLPTTEQLARLDSDAEGAWEASIEAEHGAIVGIVGLTKGSAMRIARAMRMLNPGARVWIRRDVDEDADG